MHCQRYDGIESSHRLAGGFPHIVFRSYSLDFLGRFCAALCDCYARNWVIFLWLPVDLRWLDICYCLLFKILCYLPHWYSQRNEYASIGCLFPHYAVDYTALCWNAEVECGLEGRWLWTDHTSCCFWRVIWCQVRMVHQGGQQVCCQISRVWGKELVKYGVMIDWRLKSSYL